jgi:CheY-like chemotaxis protein
MTRCSILIVEDESLIAMMLEDFVDALGYAVAGTEDTVSGALARVQEGGFDLAILDVHLRGEPCWPVADALADQGIPFVLATGGHTEPPPERHASVAVLAKPFTLAGVEQVVASVATT